MNNPGKIRSNFVIIDYFCIFPAIIRTILRIIRNFYEETQKISKNPQKEVKLHDCF